MPKQNDIADDFAARLACANPASRPRNAIEGIHSARDTVPAVSAVAELIQDNSSQSACSVAAFAGAATVLMAVLPMRTHSFGSSPAPLLR